MRLRPFPMKYWIITFLIIFIATYGYAQVNDYNTLWKKVNDLIAKKYTKSALTEVDNIYALAKKQKNEGQLIKALIYKLRLSDAIEENSDVKSIAAIEKEITTAQEPARSILYSIAAEMYRN